MNKIKAFTLAEVMVTLAVMGVLASIMLPVVKDINPDRNKAAFKKAYYVAERIIYDMVTDDDLYPSLGTYKGFDNLEEVKYKGKTCSGQTKFCCLFGLHVNRVGWRISGLTCGNSGQFKLTTSDGIAWDIPKSNFQSYKDNVEDETHALKITIDVNGKDNPPNTHGQDRYEIFVKADGRVFVLGDKEKEYIRSYSVQQDN